jgi:diguanylate cyclase (GGDEF)-like protein
MVDARQALKVLLDLTRRLGEDAPLEESLVLVTDAALALLPGHHASIRLFDESRTELLCGARSGAGATQPPVSFRPGEGLVGWVAREGRSARVDDVTQDPRFVRRTSQGFDIRSAMAVPLLAGDSVIGVLAISARETTAYGEEHDLLARLLANCAVPAIERARLRRLALTDEATLAYNRRYMLPRLEEEMRKARDQIQPLSLLLFRPDRFDEINERHGIEAGDRLLKTMVNRVRTNIRLRDVLVRRAGVSFALIMPDTTTPAAQRVAERIRTGVAERPLPLAADLSARTTLSVGVLTWNGRDGAEGLEQRAAEAMEQARAGGGDRLVVVER